MAVELASKKPVLIWNKTFETMERNELKKVQLERLKSLVERAYHNVPFYRNKFQEAGIVPEDIKSLEDIHKLPFTSKYDLRDNYPFGMFAVPMEQIVRLHASSGTTGKPVVGAYTRNDLALWGEVMARTYTSGGVTAKDVVHNAYGYGLFTGGLGFHCGAERVGATTIPISGGQSEKQIMLLQDFEATVLGSTPSYSLVLAETMDQLGVSKGDLKLRVGFFGAEPWTEKMRVEIEERLGLEAFDIYGLTEIIGPGVAVVCPYHDGLHIFEDHFYPEIVDPETGEPLPEGSVGELVFTSLTKEAFPVLRFRTRDRTRLMYEQCRCGRTMVRMEKITGRTDDMLIIRGVNVFPSQIEEKIIGQEGIEPQYAIYVTTNEKRLDDLEVQVEASDKLYNQGKEAIDGVAQKLTNSIFQTLGINVKVTIKDPRTIARSEGKAKRVFDLRKSE
ncbi:MAG: phenylacetate--CoA ligase [Clostridia bacterium]|nr:phenylacetate--CoA ligase [Clostridia bacterium]